MRMHVRDVWAQGLPVVGGFDYYRLFTLGVDAADRSYVMDVCIAVGHVVYGIYVARVACDFPFMACVWCAAYGAWSAEGRLQDQCTPYTRYVQNQWDASVVGVVVVRAWAGHFPSTTDPSSQQPAGDCEQPALCVCAFCSGVHHM